MKNEVKMKLRRYICSEVLRGKRGRERKTYVFQSKSKFIRRKFVAMNDEIFYRNWIKSLWMKDFIKMMNEVDLISSEDSFPKTKANLCLFYAQIYENMTAT